MTEKLYWNDAYAKEFSAKITKINGNEVVLDKTLFYPTGGGQPNDTGKIICNGSEYRVVDVKSNDDEIIHVLDKNLDAHVGDTVNGVIDWDRRYKLMRLHSAIHLIDGILENKYKSSMITGGQIYEDRARIDIDMQELNKEKAEELISEANKVAKEGHEIQARFIPRDEALKIEGLARTETGTELIKKLAVKALESTDLRLYPKEVTNKLTENLAKLNGVDKESVILSHGADQMIELILKMFEGNAKIFLHNPTYSYYRIAAINHGLTVITDEYINETSLNMKSIQENSPDLVFVCNPNNPTGHIIPKEQIKELLENRNLVLVLDETYAEISGVTNNDLLNDYDNLIILRTFSKAYGLAGLRIG